MACQQQPQLQDTQRTSWQLQLKAYLFQCSKCSHKQHLSTKNMTSSTQSHYLMWPWLTSGSAIEP